MKKGILITCLCIGSLIAGLPFVAGGEPEFKQEDINEMVLDHETRLQAIEGMFGGSGEAEEERQGPEEAELTQEKALELLEKKKRGANEINKMFDFN